jgi:hypothetical protein
VGLQGGPGPAGPTGSSGISGWQYVTAGREFAPDTSGRIFVGCPNGKKALGGGVATYPGPYATKVLETAPAGEATGWTAVVRNEGNTLMTSYAWAICAYVSS